MLTADEIRSWKSLPPDLRSLNVSVLGLARSGFAAAELLHRAGCRVFVSDISENSTVSLTAKVLEKQGIRCETGRHSEAVLKADFLVRSPGIPADIPILKEARRKGLLVVSEIELAGWFCRAPIVAVTGSNGKTTTAEWLGDLFRRADREVVVCGNVGRPFTQAAAELSPESVAVVEVSSFQLEDIVRFHPHTAIITNFSPDHLDRYDDYGEYINTKCRIFARQTEEDALIYNRADAEVSSRVQSAAARRISFGTDAPPDVGAGVRGGRLVIRREGGEIALMDRRMLSLPGNHNLENALAVACAAVEMDVPEDVIVASLTRFPGVPHRLETVLEKNGVRWINDSKATNIASGMVALNCFEKPVILLAGGRHKGGDFRSIASAVAAKVRRAILFGEAGPVIEDAWKDAVPVTRVEGLDQAVAAAALAATEGDVVLLSPMCASFDEFDNYEHRGETFKQWVRNYVAEV